MYLNQLFPWANAMSPKGFDFCRLVWGLLEICSSSRTVSKIYLEVPADSEVGISAVPLVTTTSLEDIALSEYVIPIDTFWLVVWNIFYFPYIGNSNPNWLIFSRGIETTNQLSSSTMSSRIAGVQSLYISDTTCVVSICSWFGLDIIPRLVFLHPVCDRHFS